MRENCASGSVGGASGEPMVLLGGDKNEMKCPVNRLSLFGSLASEFAPLFPLSLPKMPNAISFLSPDQSFSWPADFLTALLETTYFDKGNTDKNAKVKGLNSGSDYYYQVTAVNAAGISPATTVQVAAQ